MDARQTCLLLLRVGVVVSYGLVVLNGLCVSVTCCYHIPRVVYPECRRVMFVFTILSAITDVLWGTVVGVLSKSNSNHESMNNDHKT